MSFNHKLLSILLILPLLAFLSACEEETPASPTEDDWTITLSPASQDFAGVAGDEFTFDLAAALKDKDDMPVSDAEVVFSILEPESYKGMLSADTVQTDTLGRAMTTWSVTLEQSADVIIRATRGELSAEMQVTLTAYTWSDGSGGWITRVDATSYDHYSYFNLVTKMPVNITDDQAATDNGWHIAWERVSGKLNGGDAGLLGVLGVDLVDTGDPNGMNFDAVTAASAALVADSLWETDHEKHVFDPWYNYDPIQHRLAPSRDVYVMSTAGGKWAKIVIDSLNSAGMPPDMGAIGIKYFYQSDGSQNLSGDVQYVEIDGSSGEAFFSFAQGGAVQIADPATSTAWDLWFNSYDLRINGGISGPGSAALLPMDVIPIESIDAVPQGAPFFTDHIASVFGSPTEEGSQWYNYAGAPTHEITSKGHVYLIKLPDGMVFKLLLTNYYLNDEGNPVSGWIEMRFKEL